MADSALNSQTTHHHKTHPLKEITVDYTPELCTHCPETYDIAVTFDDRGGSRWRSPLRYHYGIFSAQIQCPKGNTSGLNFNLYLSSLEGDNSQDEIDFEFLGKDKTIVQTNFFIDGVGNREMIHDLGFDCCDGFHEYMIKWFPTVIEWLIDGKLIRKVERESSSCSCGTSSSIAIPEKPMFLYASVWDASYIASGTWTGPYVGSHPPYVCHYRNVHVPLDS